MFSKASGWQDIGKGKSASVFLSQRGTYIAVVGRTKFYLRTLSKKLRSTNFSDLPDGREIVMRCASKQNKGQTYTNTVGRFFWDSKNNFKYKVKPAQCGCENLKLIGQYTPLVYTELQQLTTVNELLPPGHIPPGQLHPDIYPLTYLPPGYIPPGHLPYKKCFAIFDAKIQSQLPVLKHYRFL